MRFVEMVQLRRDALNPAYSVDSPAVCAMGVVRAAGKFLKHLARSTRDEPLGTDHRPAVVEALGDMLAYCCGIADDSCEPFTQDKYSCAECVADVLRLAADAIVVRVSPYMLVSSVYTLCHVCAISVDEAFKISLEKMQCLKL